MRIFFLVLSFILISKSYAVDIRKDSLYIEEIRKEGLELKRKGDFIGSIDRIEFAITEAKQLQLPESFINERLRDFLANRYSNIGDFDRAIELTKNLESFFRDKGDLRNELDAKTNLGVFNQNIGRHAIAYHYFLEGWEIQKESNEVVDKLDWLDGLSANCIELGRFNEARIYLDKAKNLLKNLQSKYREVLLVYYYINESNYALAVSEDSQAENYLLKCVKLTEEFGFRKGADAYNLLANLLLKQGRNEQAIDYAGRGISLFVGDQDTLAQDPYLLQSYSLQAKAFLALNNYKEALLSCRKAEDQAFFFQRKYMFDESKLYIGELRRENLETGVMALYYQYQQSGNTEYLEQALVYANRAKSSVLNERWSNSKRLLLDNRKDAANLRVNLISQLNEAKKNGGSSDVIVLRNKLDSLNNVLGIKNEPPFLIKDLKAFQSSLKKERICLEYMMIDTLLFRFDIQKNAIGWSAEVMGNPRVIFDFYHILRNSASTSQEFISAASKLPALLPSHLLKNSIIKEISVIPDGVLNYMIFDALPSSIEAREWKDIRYLAEDYSFSYQFSIPSSENQVEKSKGNYLGFAPDYSESKKWATLKNSRQALAKAQDYFEGNSYFGAEATIKKMQKMGPDADILHLHTHGVSNDSSYDASYVLLQDGKMNVNEVLALPLSTKLCFLTACEVGLGKEYKGEGITSIAWAFKAAGAENVVQSMWKLNEQSSYLLTNYFFTHLSKEINSAEALTKAKREYLTNSEISERLKHPYYWSGIGHYGNGATFTKKAFDWWKVVWGFVLLFGVCFSIGKYMINKRKGLTA